YIRAARHRKVALNCLIACGCHMAARKLLTPCTLQSLRGDFGSNVKNTSLDTDQTQGAPHETQTFASFAAVRNLARDCNVRGRGYLLPACRIAGIERKPTDRLARNRLRQIRAGYRRPDAPGSHRVLWLVGHDHCCAHPLLPDQSADAERRSRNARAGIPGV